MHNDFCDVWCQRTGIAPHSFQHFPSFQPTLSFFNTHAPLQSHSNARKIASKRASRQGSRLPIILNAWRIYAWESPQALPVPRQQKFTYQHLSSATDNFVKLQRYPFRFWVLAHRRATFWLLGASPLSTRPFLLLGASPSSTRFDCR